MKRLVIYFFSFFVSHTVQSQNLKSVDEFDFVIATKKDYDSYQNLFEVRSLITDFGTFQKGEELLIKYPSNNNLRRFSWIAANKYSLINAMAMIMYPSSNSNTIIVIDNLSLY